MPESKNTYNANLELYEKVVATMSGIKRKGKTMPFTSHNGHMFSLLTKEGNLALRLSDKDRDAFVQKYKTDPVIQYGAVMKKYVEIPQKLLQDTNELKKYFELSYKYINTLKPK